MGSFDDLLDRLAFGWVIRCDEGRPARDKVNRGETLFAGRVCSGDLADTEVTVLLVQPRRGLMRRLCDAVRRSRERYGEYGLAYVYLWPIPGREPNVSWGPGFAGAWSELFDARLRGTSSGIRQLKWSDSSNGLRLTRASAMRRLRPICGTFSCCKVLPRARPKRP